LPLFESSSQEQSMKTTFSQTFVLAITVAITVAIGVYPEKIIELCRFIAYNI